MSLTGSSTAEKIYNYLYKYIKNAYGTAGLMGNLYAESGLESTNLQNTYNTKLGMTDAEYTTAVDDGSYTKFSSDSAGYGLAQWTSSGRKANMLEYHQGKSKSIGDLETQLGFMVSELKSSYSAVWKTLQSATSVQEASDAVLTKYERPADQSDSVKSKRASYGETYYSKYASASTSSSSSSSSSSTSTSSSVTTGSKLTLKNCPLYANSTTTSKAKTVTGTYYLWSNAAVNGRYRITNAKSKCGISGQVTGWIDAGYVDGTITTSSSSVKSGAKLTLKNCPLYVSSTATKASATKTGTYYLWSATAVNNRYRITTKASYAGKAGQITGWIDAAYV